MTELPGKLRTETTTADAFNVFFTRLDEIYKVYTFNLKS